MFADMLARTTLYLALATELAATGARAEGRLGTLESGRYLCEVPGDAAGLASIPLKDMWYDVINASSGRSNASMNLFPERVLTKAYPRTFRLALLDKDVGIAVEIARDMGVNAPVLELASRLYREAHAAMGEEVDHVEIVRWMRGEWSGDRRQKTEGGRGPV